MVEVLSPKNHFIFTFKHSMSHALCLLFPSQRSTIFHCFHLHASPTFCSTIIKTSIDFILTCRLYLRKSIEFVFRSFAINDLAYKYKMPVQLPISPQRALVHHRPQVCAVDDHLRHHEQSIVFLCSGRPFAPLQCAGLCRG